MAMAVIVKERAIPTTVPVWSPSTAPAAALVVVPAVGSVV